MKILMNEKTGTVHLAESETKDDGNPLKTSCGEYICGNKNRPDLVEDDEWWYDDFPEDFGDAHNECQLCARSLDVEQSE